MIPVLFKFVFDGGLAQLVLYLLAVGLIGYAAWSGYSGAVGPQDSKTGKFAPPKKNDAIQRAVIFGVIGAVLARVGLYYALPSSAFLGGKGEGLPVHTYGVLLASGFLAAVTVAGRLAKSEWPGKEGEKKREQIMDLAFWALVGGLGGSRILFILVNWQQYAADPLSMFSLGGGLVFYGGLIGAAFAAFLWARKNQINFLRLSDLALPTVSLGQCLGRLGCFSAGCCWGDFAPSHYALGAHFPGAGLAKTLLGGGSNTPSLAYGSQAMDNRWVIESTGQVVHDAVPGAVRISEWVLQHGHTLPVYPTQLFESVGQLSLFLLLLWARGYRRFHGMIAGMWLMSYAVLRTSVELFRGDLERGTFHGLLESFGFNALAQAVPLEAWYNISTSQFISLCMFTFGAVLIWRQSRQLPGVSTAPGLASAA